MLVELTLLTGAGVWLGARKPKKNLAQAILAPARPQPLPANCPSGARQLLRDFKSAIAADERQRLQADIDPKVLEIIENEHRRAVRRMKLALGSMGLAALGTIYPSLYIFGALGVIYLSRRMFLRLRKDFKLKHYLSANLVGLTMTMAMLATGHLALAAFAGVMGSLFAIVIDRVEGNVQHQLIHTFAEHPEYVWLLKDGAEIRQDFNSVQVGDIVIVNTGETIPVDGTICAGMASIDQHILTGESQPVDKTVGDKVFASTLILSGRIDILVATSGKATVAAKIGQVLGYTQSYKDTLITRGRVISDRFIPFTLGIGAITWAALGTTPAIAVLWSGTGATMGILGPISALIYSQILARNGILIKDGRALESMREVNTVVFDKTGTLTQEQPAVAQIHSFGGYAQDEILTYAAAAEYRQQHPIARAILAMAAERRLELPPMDTASYQIGYGIKVSIDDKVVRVGSLRFMQYEQVALPDDIEPIREGADRDSHSLVYVGIDGELGGILEMQPSIRPEARALVEYLKRRGLNLVIISGDHEAPTRRLAETLGIERYFAETLPENKADIVQRLRAEGDFVCYIGDGINDAIALKSAQLSISLKGASTAAVDTAQIIFMDGTLESLKQLFMFMDEFEETMQKNLVSSIAPGIASIGGIYLLHFGIVAAMALTYLGCFVGLGYSLYPLIKYRDSASERDGDANPVEIAP